jgi:hypothetical protein
MPADVLVIIVIGQDEAIFKQFLSWQKTWFGPGRLNILCRGLWLCLLVSELVVHNGRLHGYRRLCICPGCNHWPLCVVSAGHPANNQDRGAVSCLSTSKEEDPSTGEGDNKCYYEAMVLQQGERDTHRKEAITTTISKHFESLPSSLSSMKTEPVVIIVVHRCLCLVA